MRIQAVIFDMDGTLIDSEPIYRVVDELFLADRGVVLSDDEWSDVVGLGTEPFLAQIQQTRGLAGDLADLVAEKDEFYLKQARDQVSIIPAMSDLIERLRAEGLAVAVATGSGLRVMNEMLRITGLDRLVDVAVSTDEVDSGKPAPDVFLEAARRLGVPASACVVIEDSQYGVEAAIAATMTAVGVPAPDSVGKPAFEKCAAVFPDGPYSLDPEVVLAVIRAGLDVPRFQQTILGHYRRHGRSQPWRETTDPYAILVSEMMLQQTQTDRVMPKYRAFLDAFPTVQTLAAASLSQVLELWQGLGYNRRARHLRDSAVMIQSEFAGKFPRTPEDLQRLPGVGPYTASAVATFAFGHPCGFIETNIRRVFIHFFFADAQQVTDAQIMPLVEQALYRDDPRSWYYALMDYGAYLARLFPNPNRKSAHYARQGRFEDSTRQLRGRIVRHLTQHAGAEAAELALATGFPRERTAAALQAMVREGMVAADGERYRLAE